MALQTYQQTDLATDLVALVAERVPTLKNLKILDLACRTGTIARAFARAGAQVVGIERHYDSWSRIPDTPGVRYLLDDVRRLNGTEHGYYNVTLCLGLLHQFEEHVAVHLLTNMRHITVDFAVVDNYPFEICALAGWEQSEAHLGNLTVIS